MNLSGWQRVLPCGCQPRAGVPYDVRPPRLSGLASIRLLPASSSSAKMANAPVTAGMRAAVCRWAVLTHGLSASRQEPRGRLRVAAVANSCLCVYACAYACAHVLHTGKGARLEDPAVYAKRAQDFDALADAFRTLRAQAAAGEPLTKEARFAASCAIARALGHVRAQREALAARDGATGEAQHIAHSTRRKRH